MTKDSAKEQDTKENTGNDQVLELPALVIDIESPDLLSECIELGVDEVLSVNPGTCMDIGRVSSEGDKSWSRSYFIEPAKVKGPAKVIIDEKLGMPEIIDIISKRKAKFEIQHFIMSTFLTLFMSTALAVTMVLVFMAFYLAGSEVDKVSDIQKSISIYGGIIFAIIFVPVINKEILSLKD